MKRKNLTTDYQLTQTPIPEILERQVHRGLTFYYPDNYPQWELFRERMLALAQRTASRTEPKFGYSGLIAALAYNIPAMGFPLRLEMRFTDGKKRSNSKVGVIGARGGVPVHRLQPPIPLTAITEISKIPVVSIPYLLCEVLIHGMLRESLPAADALVRRALGESRHLNSEQKAAFNDLKQATRKVITQELTHKETKLALSRLRLVSPLAESALESIVRADLTEMGVQEIVEQHEIVTPGGVFYADLYLPAANLIIECDGEAKYALDPDKSAERRRQEQIEQAGFQVIRISWKQAKDRDYLLQSFAHRPGEL